MALRQIRTCGLAVSADLRGGRRFGVRPIAGMGNSIDRARMTADAYFLPDQIEISKLDPWTDLLPRMDRILQVTLFADVVLGASDGTIHLLEPAAGSCSSIAASEEEFRRRVQADEDGWQLRPLAEKCLAAGKRLSPGKCYAFTTLPLFGGAYEPDNVWIAPTEEWLAFTGDIYLQTKELPDGAVVELEIGD